MQQKILTEAYKIPKEDSERMRRDIYEDMLYEGNVAIACLFTLYKFVAFKQNPEKILPRGVKEGTPGYEGMEARNAAYMNQASQTLWMNRDIPRKYWSIIARHEVLHFFLKHEERAVKQLAVEVGLDPNTISAEDILKIKDRMYRSEHFRELVNLPSDNEIAVKAYEDSEEEDMRDVVYKSELDAEGNPIPDERASKAMFLYHEIFIPILSDCEELEPYLGMPYEQMVHEMYKKYYGLPTFKVIDGIMNSKETCFKGDDGTIYGKESEVDL